jgi:uncharacterized protein YukE
MDKLKIDTEVLRESVRALDLVDSEFTDANNNSDALADAVGHNELADRVRNFAHNWDHRRKEMIEAIESLRKILTEGADTIEQTDQKLASNLTDPAPAPAPSPSPGPSPTPGAPR